MQSYMSLFRKLEDRAQNILESMEYPTPENFDFLNRYIDIVSLIREEFTVEGTLESMGFESKDHRKILAD